MKRLVAVVVSMALAGSVIATQAQQDTTATTTQTTTTKTAHKKAAAKNAAAEISAQLSEMKQAIDAQQAQIKALTDLVQSRDQKIESLEQRLDQSQSVAAQAQAKADTAVAQSAEEQQTVGSLKSDVTDLKTSATTSAQNLQETQKKVTDLESPLAIRYKGVTITPGGFLAGESVYRNRALGADATPFNSLNYPGSGENQISEFFGSGRQSQINMKFEAMVRDVKLTGYYEADFLSAGVTSNNNQTNSYTLRQRQAWAQALSSSGWSFTGGQMWTLATETKKGVDNNSEARPMTVDPNYNVGFTFARQWGFRVAKNFDNHFWLAASLENPQTIFAASGNASNFAFGGAGVGAGLYNSTANYSFNSIPDVIAKAVWEPGFGHYEVFGILSRFRDRVYPCVEFLSTSTTCTALGATSVTGAYNDSKNAGGIGANGRFSTFHKHMDFGLHALYGNGIGRYAASNLPDATINPDGTLAPLRSYQGLASLEFHYPKLDWYFYGGEDYVGRHSQIDPVSGKVVGYGAPTFADAGCYTETAPSAGSGYAFGTPSCSGNTQRTIEGTMGFWINAYSGPKGRLRFGPQYSYVTREAWTGTGAPGAFVAPHGIDNVIYTSFRYYLP